MKQLMCYLFGHKWSIYGYGGTYYDPQGEMAGHCSRCDVDTHDMEDSVPYRYKRDDIIGTWWRNRKLRKSKWPL